MCMVLHCTQRAVQNYTLDVPNFDSFRFAALSFQVIPNLVVVFALGFTAPRRGAARNGL